MHKKHSSPDPASPAPKSPTPGSRPAAGKRRHKERRPPWTSPLQCLWLVTALVLSGWLAVCMPEHRSTAPRPASQSQVLPGQARQEKSLPAEKSAGHAATAPSRSAEGVAAPASGTGPAPEAMTGKAAASGTPPAVSPEEKQARSSDGPSAGKKSGMSGRHRQKSLTAADKLLDRAWTFGRLFLFVGLGAMLGSMIEGRCWYRVLASSLGRVTNMARLPRIVGIAMPTALASGPAADSMLVASRNRGEISNSALIAGGMLNSYLAHISHSLRILFPVVAAIGLPGLLYFLIQFGGGALIVAGVLIWNRLRTDAETAAADRTADGDSETGKLRPWPEVLHKGLIRALTLLFRLACVSVPMILAMEWLIRSGGLDFWDTIVPEAVSRYFPEQLLTIMAAQIGGLIQSSAVGAGLMAQGLITQSQILLAMLLSSAVSNPVRTMRRNLPTALAIFPPRIACIIVIGMQISRFLVTVAASALVILWMHLQTVA